MIDIQTSTVQINLSRVGCILALYKQTVSRISFRLLGYAFFLHDAGIEKPDYMAPKMFEPFSFDFIHLKHWIFLADFLPFLLWFPLRFPTNQVPSEKRLALKVKNMIPSF